MESRSIFYQFNNEYSDGFNIFIPYGNAGLAMLCVMAFKMACGILFCNFICNPLGFKLAVKVFNFRPDKEYGIWNPVPFFISLQMSFIIPLIFGWGFGGLPLDIFLYMWPVRWFVAYCLINFIVRPLAFKLAIKVFNFNPEAH
ncbi:MAG: hypothetical protein E7Z73_03030 [Methanobrevibacter millerae]|uniref:Uncharacterized protein n=1 Tax=Methanobrevibacter millerae TaxID=230361 RepID=A0A8T3VES4_9EURY|nr:hypothetical protein [Methanobrevibacter millerae]MBE6504706.1 hypothetical protein [Methanobrevibacter millerae]